jgi:glycyl-tRNA synthetase (class II)
VTLRERDSLEQIRLAIDKLPGELSERLGGAWRSPKLNG